MLWQLASFNSLTYPSISQHLRLQIDRTPENPLVGRSKVRIKFLILGLRLAAIRI